MQLLLMAFDVQLLAAFCLIVGVFNGSNQLFLADSVSGCSHVSRQVHLIVVSSPRNALLQEALLVVQKVDLSQG